MIVSKLITLRDDLVPERLIVLRMGTHTLNDRPLAEACDRAHARWGLHAFSVLEVPDNDFRRLARLRPEVPARPKFFEASGPELLGAGFPLLPTLDYPHWSVVLSQPSLEQFQRVRSLFRGPIDNPVWAGWKG